MGLAADLANLADEPIRRVQCAIGIVVHSLNDQDRDALIAALADEAVRAASLARVLRTNGHSVSDHAMRRLRRRECLWPGDDEECVR